MKGENTNSAELDFQINSQSKSTVPTNFGSDLYTKTLIGRSKKNYYEIDEQNLRVLVKGKKEQTTHKSTIDFTKRIEDLKLSIHDSKLQIKDDQTIANWIVNADLRNTKKFTIDLTLGNLGKKANKLYFEAPSEELRNQWVAALENLVNKYYEENKEISTEQGEPPKKLDKYKTQIIADEKVDQS